MQVIVLLPLTCLSVIVLACALGELGGSNHDFKYSHPPASFYFLFFTFFLSCKENDLLEIFKLGSYSYPTVFQCFRF